MAKYREVPCKHYIARGQCRKGREAVHKKYCQHCDKYYPRTKVRNINKKRIYNEKMRASSGKDGAFVTRMRWRKGRKCWHDLSIETKLDEADRQMIMSEERLSHEQS